MASNLPPNVHVSQHPSLQAKISQLRSESTSSRETNALVHEIALIVACEALSQSLTTVAGPKDKSPIGAEYETTEVSPNTMCIVPILRSGLAMTMLPRPVPVHHLGMYREPSTLDPVEYYNNLPHHIPADADGGSASSLAILVDPIIATGGTCAAAIQTLREWGARRVLVLSVIGADEGVRQAAREWPEGTELWVAAVDADLTKEGMVKPGLGDVGDRLFLTIGK
ncbi:uracil phosphoribosyltransferase [Cordyceps militaris CM01]|uniref:uracil phosphoribosyltransferase n=1 Tax=Cordyceps militaris (strain CM01) TaxID=983644 RepID=G3JA93_CORMM|nr:uracil phosphoribosyltransferase [Cordyceps militaris CM01]EGX94263.1 uracil phosphoribosyltransferase [Cordyceps militaris CM01]